MVLQDEEEQEEVVVEEEEVVKAPVMEVDMVPVGVGVLKAELLVASVVVVVVEEEALEVVAATTQMELVLDMAVDMVQVPVLELVMKVDSQVIKALQEEEEKVVVKVKEVVGMVLEEGMDTGVGLVEEQVVVIQVEEEEEAAVAEGQVEGLAMERVSVQVEALMRVVEKEEKPGMVGLAWDLGWALASDLEWEAAAAMGWKIVLAILTPNKLLLCHHQHHHHLS